MHLQIDPGTAAGQPVPGPAPREARFSHRLGEVAAPPARGGGGRGAGRGRGGEGGGGGRGRGGLAGGGRVPQAQGPSGESPPRAAGPRGAHTKRKLSGAARPLGALLTGVEVGHHRLVLGSDAHAAATCGERSGR